jgi:hypothetical protein
MNRKYKIFIVHTKKRPDQQIRIHGPPAHRVTASPGRVQPGLGNKTAYSARSVHKMKNRPTTFNRVKSRSAF